MSDTAQRRLAAFVADSTPLSPDACNVARQSLLDCVAVAFAGRHEPVHQRLSAYLASGERPARGVPHWLDGTVWSPETAALVNAAAVHALDYDDVTPAWRGHPGTVIWPAILAVADPKRKYADLLDAFVVGFEVGAQIGSDLVAYHYSAGWHSTATIGAIAGAAACARLLGLDASRAFHALGLAAAQSCGLQANFGSMAKPLQAGFSASAAVRSALLAQHGIEAGDVLEGRNGYSHLYGAAPTLRLTLPILHADDLAIQRVGIEVKQFPNCYAAHRAVEAALLLREQLRSECKDEGVVDIRSIRGILIEGTKGAHKALLARAPTSVDESRFSVEYAVACALADGELKLSTFAPANLQRPQIRELLGLARAREVDTLGPLRAARVCIELADDRTLQSTVVSLPGTFGDPPFMHRLRNKVADCLSDVGLENFAEPLWNAVMSSSSDEAISLQSSLLPAIWAQDASRK